MYGRREEWNTLRRNTKYYIIFNDERIYGCTDLNGEAGRSVSTRCLKNQFFGDNTHANER